MPAKERWKDLTRLLPKTFRGQSREKIFEAWEAHFKNLGIETRRVGETVQVNSKRGKYRYERKHEKLQIKV